MFRTPRCPPLRLSALTLLAAVGALQLGAFGAGARSSSSEAHLALSAPPPPAAPTCDAPGFEHLDGDPGADGRGPVPPRAVDARLESVGGVSGGFCPWRAPDALARAGRVAAPSTAPPVSPV